MRALPFVRPAWAHACGFERLQARSDGSLLQAAAWAVACHNMAGQYCARTAAEVGYLARELADCIPQALQELQGAFRAGACGPHAAR